MSLIDPARRFWRRPWFATSVVVALWIVMAVAAFSFGYGWVAIVDDSDGLGTLLALFIGMTVSIIAMVATMFAARRRADPDDELAGQLPASFGVQLVSAAIGITVGQLLMGQYQAGRGAWQTFAILAGCLVVAGAGLLVFARWSSRRTRVNQRRIRSVQHSGTRATAKVTDVRNLGLVNYVPEYKVTLEYTDGAGQTRWHRTSQFGWKPPRVGEQYTLRYDPENPGRKSTIIVAW